MQSDSHDSLFQTTFYTTKLFFDHKMTVFYGKPTTTKIPKYIINLYLTRFEIKTSFARESGPRGSHRHIKKCLAGMLWQRSFLKIETLRNHKGTHA